MPVRLVSQFRPLSRLRRDWPTRSFPVHLGLLFSRTAHSGDHPAKFSVDRQVSAPSDQQALVTTNYADLTQSPHYP